jgi:hypothetical protein
VCIAYFRFINRHVENKFLENFQDMDFEDLERQQAGFEGKCFVDACCTYFPYLSIGLHACSCCRNGWEKSYESELPCIILVTRIFG